MFSKKYKVTILDSKWHPIKKSVKFSVIPRKDEFIWCDELYYQVLNVVHSMDKSHNIFIIVELVSNTENTQ
jgi:hypothetical protein